jgi:hypothetical protein
LCHKSPVVDGLCYNYLYSITPVRAAKNHTARAESPVFKTQKSDLSGHSTPTVRFNLKKTQKKRSGEIFFQKNISVRKMEHDKKPHHARNFSVCGKKPHRRLVHPERKISYSDRGAVFLLSAAPGFLLSGPRNRLLHSPFSFVHALARN